MSYSVMRYKISSELYIVKSDVIFGTSREMRPGGRLNKKDGLTRYGDSHVKDKTS